MEIISSSGIKINYATGKVIQIAYHDIRTMTKINWGVDQKENIVIRTYQGKTIRIPFEDVTEPLHATVEGLMATIRRYNLRGGNSASFEASVGQTSFEVVFELTGNEEYTKGGSVQAAGFARVDDYHFNYTGSALRGGEIITVKN